MFLKIKAGRKEGREKGGEKGERERQKQIRTTSERESAFHWTLQIVTNFTRDAVFN